MDGTADAAGEHIVMGPDNARYRVRPPQAEDADRYVAYLERNWSRFRGCMPTAGPQTFAAEAYRQHIARLADVSEEPASAMFLLIEVEDAGRVLGDVAFSNIVYGPFRACHLGFKIDRDLEGLGVMRTTVESCCDMMFARLRLHRIMANHRPENVRSAALLERLGFQVEGLARDYLHLDGEWRDHVLTSLIRPCDPWASDPGAR